jgi:hypothetical protein
VVVVPDKDADSTQKAQNFTLKLRQFGLAAEAITTGKPNKRFERAKLKRPRIIVMIGTEHPDYPEVQVYYEAREGVELVDVMRSGSLAALNDNLPNFPLWVQSARQPLASDFE